VKTSQEIEDLKQSWLQDPCWDIETTEGFEEHKKELLAFREQTEKLWEDARLEELQKKSVELGCPGNHALVRRFEVMQDRFDELLAKVERLENHIH
jgi:hypothetical protein